jgi:hypothetical protein
MRPEFNTPSPRDLIGDKLKREADARNGEADESQTLNQVDVIANQSVYADPQPHPNDESLPSTLEPETWEGHDKERGSENPYNTSDGAPGSE